MERSFRTSFLREYQDLLRSSPLYALFIPPRRGKRKKIPVPNEKEEVSNPTMLPEVELYV
jgi:hypothetical protein